MSQWPRYHNSTTTIIMIITGKNRHSILIFILSVCLGKLNIEFESFRDTLLIKIIGSTFPGNVACVTQCFIGVEDTYANPRTLSFPDLAEVDCFLNVLTFNPKSRFFSGHLMVLISQYQYFLEYVTPICLRFCHTREA